MSSNNKSEYKVNMVRIRHSNKSDTITYKNNVTVCIVSDGQRSSKYLLIKSDEKTVFIQEFRELQWVHDSSTNGVTTIRSSKDANIIIIYDAENKLLVAFFDSLQVSLTHEPRTTSVDSVSLQSNQDQLESMIDDLIKSIHSGASDEAEHIAQELAKSRADVQFILINKNDNQEKNITKSKPNNDAVASSDSILQLSLRIECPLNEDSIITSIDVRSGTTLQSLKQQIEKETDIKCADQYWFAFDRYPIPNEYIFGSSVSFGSNQNQQESSVHPIQSGDTLIIYIAQMSPVKIKI